MPYLCESPMRMLRSFALLCVVVSLAACSSAAEYPNAMKTNVTMGRTSKDMSAYPVSKNYTATPLKGEGLIHTAPAESSDNAICVGAWCSCATQ